MRHELRQRTGLLVRLTLVTVAVALASLSGLFAQVQQQPPDRSQRDVANYVRERVLGGDFGNRTLWMTSSPVDQTHVLRDPILKRKFDLRVPYPRAWVVMIDDQPKANFGHDVRWLLVDDQLTKHTDPIKKDFPPLVLSRDGAGPAVAFRCVPGVTPVACEDTASLPVEAVRPSVKVADSCLYAVLVSGGISSGSNYSRYRQNLRSMYNLLRGCGYPAAHIYVYYADGTAQDFDNADGDNNDATGSDVTAGANEPLSDSEFRIFVRRLIRGATYCSPISPTTAPTTMVSVFGMRRTMVWTQTNCTHRPNWALIQQTVQSAGIS